MANKLTFGNGVTDLDDFLKNKGEDISPREETEKKVDQKGPVGKEKRNQSSLLSEIERLFEIAGDFEGTSTIVSRDFVRKLSFLATYSEVKLSQPISIKRLIHNILTEYFEKHAETFKAIEDEYRKSERIF